MNVEFDMSEVVRLAADIAEAPPKLERTSSQKLSEIAAQLRDDARAAAPVDTGELRNSISMSGGRDYRRVAATAAHAFYVEFGTSDTGPQPYMWPAADRAEQAMHEQFPELLDPFT